jgi:hypothetical protein
MQRRNMKVEISLDEENYDLIEEANYFKQLWGQTMIKLSK